MIVNHGDNLLLKFIYSNFFTFVYMFNVNSPKSTGVNPLETPTAGVTLQTAKVAVALLAPLTVI